MQGFQLTQEVQDEGFAGGTVQVANGYMFDVGEAIRSGEGMIITNDEPLGTALMQYPALKQVDPSDLPADATPIPAPWSDVAGVVVDTPPYIPQVPNDAITMAEIPAEHADEPATPEQAIQAGEAVSGQQEQATPDTASQSRRASRSSSPQSGESPSNS